MTTSTSTFATTTAPTPPVPLAPQAPPAPLAPQAQTLVKNMHDGHRAINSSAAPASTSPESSAPSVSSQIDQARARRLLDRALTLSQQGDRQGAIVACRQAVSLAPHEASGYSILGMLLEQAGDTQGAIAAYQKVIEHSDDCEAERESLFRLHAKSAQIRATAGTLDSSLTIAAEQNALPPELPAPGDVGISPGDAGIAQEISLSGRSAFRSRVLPLLILSTLSLLALVCVKLVAQSPSTTPAERSVPAPAIGAPETAAAGTTASQADGAPGNAGAGTAATSPAGEGRASLNAPVARERTQATNVPVRAPRRAVSTSAPGDSRTGRRTSSGATRGVSQPALPPGTGVAPVSSQPQEMTVAPSGAADINSGGASPNGKPFNPTGSGFQGYIRINPSGDAAP